MFLWTSPCTNVRLHWNRCYDGHGPLHPLGARLPQGHHRNLLKTNYVHWQQPGQHFRARYMSAVYRKKGSMLSQNYLTGVGLGKTFKTLTRLALPHPAITIPSLPTITSTAKSGSGTPRVSPLRRHTLIIKTVPIIKPDCKQRFHWPLKGKRSRGHNGSAHLENRCTFELPGPATVPSLHLYPPFSFTDIFVAVILLPPTSLCKQARIL